MTLVLTGATGFIGGRLVERLVGEERALRVLVRASSRTERLRELGVETAVVDLESGAGLDEALEGAEAVLHLAGAVRAWRSGDYARANVESTRQLVRAAARAGAQRFLLVSSLAAAGPSAPGRARDEDDPPAPVNLYGQSKLAAEGLLAELAPPELSWSVVRPCIVYGPGDRDVLTLFRACARGLGPYSAPRGTEISLVHVDDLVELLLAALARAPRGATYFASDGQPVTWPRLVELIGESLGRRARPLRLPPALLWPPAICAELSRLWLPRPPLLCLQKWREAVQPGWVCSNDRARRDLGFEPRVSLRDGVEQTARWYDERGWLNRR